MNAIPFPAVRPTSFAALAFALLYLLTPDCCLYGRHAYGFGMYAFGPICRAAAN